jgi:2-oxoglutarate dehydrogenase E2 component (dihydrolipoamide succinyltransferase)
MTNIVVPTLGESVSEATVANWLVKEGDSIKTDQPVVELETDKVTLEVNAPADGVISRLVAKTGETVTVGALLAEIGAAGSAPAKAPEAAAPVVAAAPAKADEGHKVPPAARKMIDDNKLDASKIDGTGKDGRITKGDVINHLEKPAAAAVAPSTAPAAPRSTGPREERVRMTRLRSKIAERLKNAQNTAAMLTTYNEVDMTNVMALRAQYKDVFEKKHGTKLGFMSFFVKASVNALKEFPAVNAEIDGDDIIYKNFYDLGVAVSTPQGLIVPVVRDCDEKTMADIEASIVDVGTRARVGKLGLDELQGGTFTITNGGIFGSLLSSPILNAPQSAILGMHKIQNRPMVMPDGSIQARPMMYLALTYDHRIIDGKEAVSFLVAVKDAIEDPQRLLLDI